jgi:hypothetical protein
VVDGYNLFFEMFFVLKYIKIIFENKILKLVNLCLLNFKKQLI